MKHINTKSNIIPIQLKLPVDYEKIIKLSDPVYSFREIMTQIDRNQFFTPKERKTGRPEFDRVKLLRIVLFAFMEYGYCSVRQIHKLCETDIRFLWLLDDTPAPSVMTIQNFIHDGLTDRANTVFDVMNRVIFEQEKVDRNHIYIDGTKLKANAGNDTWVWKKSCIKNRNKTFEKITVLLEEINAMAVIAAQALFLYSAFINIIIVLLKLLDNFDFSEHMKFVLTHFVSFRFIYRGLIFNIYMQATTISIIAPKKYV